MRTLVLLLALGIGVAAQRPDDCKDCPDKTRPWLRGTVEVQCAKPTDVQKQQDARPGHTVVPCAVCKHKCDPFDERANETGRRKWDPACKARCSTDGCACPHPCDS